MEPKYYEIKRRRSDGMPIIHNAGVNSDETDEIG